MSVEVCDYQRVKKRVVSILNEGDEDSPYSGAPADFSIFSSDEIRDSIFEADAAFCAAIISNLAHWYRPQFISAIATEISPGAQLPAMIGPHDKVETQANSDDTWSDALALRNKSRYLAIKAIKSAPDLRDRYYFIEHGRFYTAAKKGRIYPPDYTPDREGLTLQTPINYERGVIAVAVGGLKKDSLDADSFVFYAQQGAMMLQMAMGGATNLPEIELYRKKDG